jgi:lipopolysaccharide heptosyltransferase II
MNIPLMKIIDAFGGRMFAAIFPVPHRDEITTPVTSILVIRPGGIGDAVLLAPAIHELKIRNPTLHITVLAEQRNAGVFALTPDVDKLFRYDRPRELLQALRCRYDVVIDTEQWHRLSALVARIASALVKIGFDTNERRRMFTGTIPYSHDDYEAISFARFLEPLGVAVGVVDMVAPFLILSESATSKAAALLESMERRPIVTMFPGASIPERRWGAENFRRVAEMLAVFGIRTVVVGGKEDRQQGEAIAGGGVGLNLAGLTSLSETAAVIKQSSLLLSGDSGILHIAVGLDVPTVSLFGPGRSKKWAPRGDRHLVINKGLSCSPCTTYGTTPPCPHSVLCMRVISVDEVTNAVTMLLTSVGALESHCCKRDWIESA